MSKQDVNSIRLTLPPREPPTYFSSGNKIGVFKSLRRAPGCRTSGRRQTRRGRRRGSLTCRCGLRTANVVLRFYCRPAPILLLKLTRCPWPPSIFLLPSGGFLLFIILTASKRKVRQKNAPW